MTVSPLITLSIVSHGDASKVTRLLASLQKYEHNTSQFQVILTDNLENDLPNFDPTSWLSLQILRNKRPRGFAYNHNQAFQMTKGEYFVILNPDLIFQQPVFERLVAGIHIFQADLIAPQIVDENGAVQDSFRALPTPLELILRRWPGYKSKSFQPDQKGMIHPDWAAGMFWLMQSDIFRQLGGLNERYRLYFEDVEFCTRARLNGMKILVDTNLQVQHDAQRSSRRNLYYLFLHLLGAVRFFTSPVYRQIRQ
jgi:GT2 family glycosyltransferase